MEHGCSTASTSATTIEVNDASAESNDSNGVSIVETPNTATAASAHPVDGNFFPSYEIDWFPLRTINKHSSFIGLQIACLLSTMIIHCHLPHHESLQRILWMMTLFSLTTSPRCAYNELRQWLIYVHRKQAHRIDANDHIPKNHRRNYRICPNQWMKRCQ